MSIPKATKTSSSGKAKPRPINVTHGAKAEKEMAKMEKEAKASSTRGDLRGTIRAAAKSSAKSVSKAR